MSDRVRLMDLFIGVSEFTEVPVEEVAFAFGRISTIDTEEYLHLGLDLIDELEKEEE